VSAERKPTRGWRLLLPILSRLPQPALSRLAGRLADVRIPRTLRRPVLGAVARGLRIDVAEAEKPIDEYPTLDSFFVRRLRAGSRSWPADPHAVASPVDGVFGEAGALDDGRLLQAKGREYTVAELLGNDGDAGRFRHGSFITIYLSPRHYHRIHAPVAGRITTLRRVPGALLPVNAAAVAGIDRLFPRNERAICMIEGAAGCVAVVAIGAFNVGRITASFLPAGGDDGTQITNPRAPLSRPERIDPPVAVERGAEIMSFHLGSTVVLLFESGRAAPSASIRRETEVQLGASIGAITSSETNAF
jgi:phosphatidylserine decarboxylase